MGFTETKGCESAKDIINLFDDADWITTFTPAIDEPGIELDTSLGVVEDAAI